MNDERVVVEENIVTTFFLATCRPSPQLSKTAMQAAMDCVHLTVEQPDDAGELADVIPLITGSAAEFYIEPMLPHIGDIDVMYHRSTQLAIPRGHPPPTQLPAEFHNYVKVFEITESHLPGYVYLKLRYLLTELVDDDMYKAVEYDEEMYLTNRLPHGNNDIHGPAIVTFLPRSLSRDTVRCIRCLVWPPQAADWPTRHRNYGWPDSATVDRVFNNGCDVVGVAHRQCKQHEWMGKLQWRMSFSRAEIVLLNSWMLVQQIVYHMLRDFMKTELLIKSVNNSGAGTLSNYHIKTLMLWACERKSRIWWTDDLSLVGICVELLYDLAIWLTEARCPNYFIKNCNLIDSSFNLEMIRSQLMSITRSWLSSWFVNNYIRRCSQLCPPVILQLFQDISTSVKLQYAVLTIVDWKLNYWHALKDRWSMFAIIGYLMSYFVTHFGLTVRSIDCLLTELRKISTYPHDCSSSVVFLHAACRTTRSGLDDEMVDVLSVVLGQLVSPRRYFNRRSSVLFLSKAVSLMKAVDDRHKSRNTVQLIEIELSKAYLYRALSCEDLESDSVYCLANVYLAILYYTTGQYQTAIDHCTLLMKPQDHSLCSSHVVQELLPKTDDDIDTVLGLAVFYQHVRMAALNQQQQTYVTVFTTELFAHYLHIKCLSVTKCQQLSDTTNSQSSVYEVQSYVKYITDMQQPFIADVLLWKLVIVFYGDKLINKQEVISRLYSAKYPTELNTTHLVELLQKSAVEHLTKFRQIEARDFGSVATIVSTDFEAMYAYKCGDYQRCLQLSTQNVHILLNAANWTGVPIFPVFIQLLDDDITSLTALTLIVNPKCRKDGGPYVVITQLTLSLYLMTQCQLKLHDSLRSLAQTLNFIEVADRRYLFEWTLDRLVLKMTAHKARIYITTMASK